MSFNFFDQGYFPEDSYSRLLDRRVGEQEYPYGYIVDGIPAGHANAESDIHAYGDSRLSPQRGLHVSTGIRGKNEFPSLESDMRYNIKSRR